MRVLQLIDSLRSGGAERMAVNYANALSKQIDVSYLCCTRLEGLLKTEVLPEVNYMFLRKKNLLDLRAFSKLVRFVKDNRIGIIHAHSSSFFMAILVKIYIPQVKVIWHDHFGRNLNNRKKKFLNLASTFFDGVISVNSSLEQWAKQNLKTRNIIYIRNFVPQSLHYENDQFKIWKSKINILCLANLRPQKDHVNLLRAVRELPHHLNFKLHLIGKDLQDKYSTEVKKLIKELLLQNKVQVHGEIKHVSNIISYFQIGVLSSSTEGLPVALLEYGIGGLAVVSTNVGQCKEVIGNEGLLVPPKDPVALAHAILFYLENNERRSEDAANFNRKIINNFTEAAIIPQVIDFYTRILEKK